MNSSITRYFLHNLVTCRYVWSVGHVWGVGGWVWSGEKLCVCVCMSVYMHAHATWSDFHLRGIPILKDSRPTLNKSDHSKTNRQIWKQATLGEIKQREAERRKDSSFKKLDKGSTKVICESLITFNTALPSVWLAYLSRKLFSCKSNSVGSKELSLLHPP